MEFEPISTTRMVALMVAGGVFACVGLYLMVRPRPEGAAKIEIFGLKFESSSAGLLVFIIGAAFLAVTLFVPEKRLETVGVAGIAPSDRAPDGEDAPAASDPAKPGAAGEAGTSANEGQNRAVTLPAHATASEVEPNDRVQEANALQIGATVEGRLKPGDIDRYAIETAGREGELLAVTLRRVAGENIYGETYNADERRTGQLSPPGSGADVERIRIDGTRVYVSVQLWTYGDSPATYELTSRIEAE